eukprot:COSAG01_NODE_22876_length_837_cov_1.124661_1_plen_206_part_10
MAGQAAWALLISLRVAAMPLSSGMMALLKEAEGLLSPEASPSEPPNKRKRRRLRSIKRGSEQNTATQRQTPQQEEQKAQQEEEQQGAALSAPECPRPGQYERAGGFFLPDVALSSRTEQGARWVTLAAQTKGGRTARTASDVQFVDSTGTTTGTGLLQYSTTVLYYPFTFQQHLLRRGSRWRCAGYSPFLPLGSSQRKNWGEEVTP